MKKGFLRCEITIKGRGVNALLGYFKDKNISIYNVKSPSAENILVTIDYVDRYKIFAICKNMCYNITKVKYKGVLSPFFNLMKYGYVTLGIVVFLLISFYFNGFLLAVEYEGSGSVLASEITATLNENGACKWQRFSKIDLKDLEIKILNSNENLSFVSCKKNGNRLVVNLSLQSTPPKTLNENAVPLCSSVDGVVKEITVYRGTPLKAVGDSVRKGEELVGAYIVINDITHPTYVLSRVVIHTEKTYNFDVVYSEENARTMLGIATFQDGGEVVEKLAYNSGGKVAVKLIVKSVISTM